SRLRRITLRSVASMQAPPRQNRPIHQANYRLRETITPGEEGMAMQQSEQVTVSVGDDHPMYRAGVVRAMKETGRIQVLAEVGDGRAALDAIREHSPAVALLDYRMPELDGLAVVNAVARDELPTRV